jgi:acetyltransferase-like isoleucine patch superfamily enzyme
MTTIHPTAVVENGAQLGDNVTVGANVIIGSNTVIGNNVTIQNNCEIGVYSAGYNIEPLVIGNNSLIRSQSIFYTGSKFGENLVTGHRVSVREGVNAGNNLQLGTLTDVQGDCLIGDYVRMHSNVHIGKHSKIGNYVWIFPYVVLTNDPHPPSDVQKGVVVEDYVVISTMSVVLPGVVVRKDTLVGAHSLVSKNTNEGTLVAGSPAKEICLASKMRLQDGSRQSAYPWRRHFYRGYPVDVVNDWKAEFKI